MSDSIRNVIMLLMMVQAKVDIKAQGDKPLVWIGDSAKLADVAACVKVTY